MRIGRRMTNPGALRTLVTIERPVMGADAGGFARPNGYTTIASMYVRWKNMHGPEAMMSQAQAKRRQARVLMRYRADVDETCTLLYQGARYEIISIDNIGARNEYMELTVQMVVSA